MGLLWFILEYIFLNASVLIPSVVNINKYDPPLTLPPQKTAMTHISEVLYGPKVKGINNPRKQLEAEPGYMYKAFWLEN